MSSEYEAELARIADNVTELAGLTEGEIADQVDRTWLISRRIDGAGYRDLWIRGNAIFLLAARQRPTDPTLVTAIDDLWRLLYREW